MLTTFSVRNVYSGRFNPGAGDEPGAGVPRRAVTFRYTSRPRQRERSQQSRKSIRRTGRTRQTRRTRRRGRGGESFRSGCRFHARHRVFSNVAHCLVDTSFSRIVVYQRGEILDPPEGVTASLHVYLSAPRGHFAPPPPHPPRPPASIRPDRPARTSKRGRLIIGLSFSLTLSPARRSPTFHPVLPVCRRTYFCAMVYRDRAIMTMPGVIGCPSSAETI